MAKKTKKQSRVQSAVTEEFKKEKRLTNFLISLTLTVVGGLLVLYIYYGKPKQEVALPEPPSANKEDMLIQEDRSVNISGSSLQNVDINTGDIQKSDTTNNNTK